ncbi:alpha/beta fold hydrolase [Xanthobacter sp. TB0136]|uniref:alpha/beta fold hydrolase n=1 Tax=Xanthobacter sp. TB0136 TaxID=3459177 RepID=UPI004039BE03
MSVFNHRDGRHIEIDGAQIYVEEKGRADGKPLVFLHGGLGSIMDFAPILPALAHDFRLIGIDSRGQGRSSAGTAPLTYERMSRDVDAILRHLSLGPATLIGHSDGGIIALRLAATGSAPLSGIVPIGAHWHLAADDPCREILSSVTPESWKNMFPASYQSYLAGNPQPDFEKITRDVVALWLNDGPEGYPGESVRNITCPLLIVRGDEDPFVSRINAAELADRVPGAHLLNLPFCGHSVQDDQPAQLIWAVRTFVETTARTPPASRG